ncbi:MAG: hypothetical protein IPP59_03490 [Betaproteobacteria bacterium]|nr:hypothetical protein [Candidatus Dechloromonas phosphorivorans]
MPVDALRPLAGPLAHAVYGHPSENLSLIAITGTNGKTTISQCLARAYPKPCAIIGTLGAGFPDALVETGFTTPEATTLMRYLAEVSRERRRRLRAGSQLDRHRGGPDERRPRRRRGVHQLHPRPPRLPRQHGSLCRRQGKLFRWPRLRTAIINLDDELGVSWPARRRPCAFSVTPSANPSATFRRWCGPKIWSIRPLVSASPGPAERSRHR